MRGSSQEDKLRIRAQLRLGSGNRRTADCWNRTSVEKGTHRRKAPVPVRVCFAGAEACTKFAPPGSHRSTEDKLGIRAQLRPTFACRRRTNIEEPNSVENGAHRRKAPAPVRVCFAVADARGKCCTPVSRCSTEDRVGIRAQLRLEPGNRRKTDTEEPTSVERDAHRSKAPVTVRVCFAGAGSRENIVPPGSRCSTEDRVRIRAQLRLEPGNRRRAGQRHRTSDEGTFVGGGGHRRAGIVSLCKIFLTSLSHFPLQIIPTGVLLSADNRNQKTL